MTNLIPPNGRLDNIILPSDPICRPSQQMANETAGSLSLRAQAGTRVALRYQENGHITRADDLPGKSSPGRVFVYGTARSQPQDSLLDIHKVWNADGTGGDGRGRLLLNADFDDGACYQKNTSPLSHARQELPQREHDAWEGGDLWCSSDVVIPQDLASGSMYTLYWVWDWPTAPRPELPMGKQEVYTTCIDVYVV